MLSPFFTFFFSLLFLSFSLLPAALAERGIGDAKEPLSRSASLTAPLTSSPKLQLLYIPQQSGLSSLTAHWEYHCARPLSLSLSSRPTQDTLLSPRAGSIVRFALGLGI